MKSYCTLCIWLKNHFLGMGPPTSPLILSEFFSLLSFHPNFSLSSSHFLSALYALSSLCALSASLGFLLKHETGWLGLAGVVVVDSKTGWFGGLGSRLTTRSAWGLGLCAGGLLRNKFCGGFCWVCGGWQLFHGGGHGGFWLLWVDSRWWWRRRRWVGRIWIIAVGYKGIVGSK